MHITRHKHFYLSVGLLFMLGSLVSVLSFGLNPSIDFSGGTVYEVSYSEERPALEIISPAIQAILPSAVIQHSDETKVLIKSVEFSDEAKREVDALLAGYGNFTQERLRQLGPAISGELANKALFAIALVILLIIVFIAYTFRTVSQPVSSWKYGIVAIIALLHDTLIPIGIFAFLGTLLITYQIDVLFVTAVLATLGYSVNDTIVIFDRVRENLKRATEKQENIRGPAFEGIVGKALRQSLRRSFFTSLTTLGVLGALFVIGGATTQPFALVLAIGVIAGTYSSLCVACPLLIYLEHYTPEPKTPKAEEEDEGEDKLPDDIKRFLARRGKG